MARPRYTARRFLNRQGFHAGAHIVAHVEDSTHEPESSWHTASLIIGDCRKTITLDFDDVHGNAAERENALRKADILIDTLTEFRAALAVEADLAAARNRRRRRSVGS